MTLEPAHLLQSALSERYHILRELGRGGMGIVYLGKDLRHGRPVAIKVMRPELVGSVSVERFHREIMTASQLTHPGIVPVHDSGQAGDVLYFVMPYIDGPSLRDVVRREGPLPIDRALRIVRDIADALAFAHSRGIVHRDIKPENILLGADRPLITDFGLALAIEATDRVRLSQSFAVGTPEYMSPEQASPHAPVDGRADQYALGCLLFELLAGEPPVTGPNVRAVFARKAAGEIHGLRIVRPMVPEPIDEAITRALQPVPGDRFASIQDFVAALNAPSHRFWRAPRIALAAGMALAAIAVVTAALGRGGPDVDPNLVVVRPFENNTGNARLDPIGAMVADWIGEGLQNMRMMRVVPTPTAQQASLLANDAARDDGGDPLARLAAATGAGVIVSGAYYLDGNRMVFRAQVSDISRPRWFSLKAGGSARLRSATEPISAPADSASSAFAQVRSRVMGLVAVAGEDPLTRAELEQQPPNYEAYLRFIRGMALYVAEDTIPAVEAFLDAYALDTTFTTALLYAAVSYSNARRYATEDSLLTIVARSENRLSQYNRRWLEYRRAFLNGDRPRALRAIRGLAADAPRSKAVYNLGIEAWENGHLEEAVGALEGLDPKAGPMQSFQLYWGALANIRHQLGNARRALDAALEAREADPGSWRAVGWELGALVALGRTEVVMARATPLAHASLDEDNWSPAEALREVAEELRAHGHRERADSIWRCALTWYRSAERGPMVQRDRLGMAHTLYLLGHFDEAESVARRLHEELPSDVGALGLLGMIAARRGDSPRANEVMSMLARLDLRYQFGRPTYQRALIAAALGNRELAIALLREARQQGRSYQMWVHREVGLEGLREMPEYKGLLTPTPLGAEVK